MSVFIIGDDLNGPTLLCEKWGRQGESLVRFNVINGAWHGTLNTKTGVLTVVQFQWQLEGQKIMDFGPLPKGDYNEVLAWARAQWRRI
jgi:hypothetical protein